MASLIPHPALGRRLVAALAVGLTVGFAFVAFFTSALHDPEPNALRVGVVGPPAAAQQVQRRLAQALPDGFEVRRYADEAGARRAIREQDVDGAFVPGRGRPRLLLAGAAGGNVSSVLRAAFGAAAGATGRRLAVADVAPVPRHDARGVSAFFLVAGTTLGSLVFGIVLFFAGGHAITTPLRLRLAFIAGFSIAAGLVMAVATELVADGLGSAFWGVAGITALLAAVVVLTTTALVRWLGTAGIALSAVFLMLFSLPATGGAIGPEFVPDFYRAVAPALPSHAALSALKGTVYFGGGGTSQPIAILLTWAAAALLLQLVAHVVRGDPPRPPATGSPLDAVRESALGAPRRAAVVSAVASPRATPPA
jgi:hypothetical protein